MVDNIVHRFRRTVSQKTSTRYGDAIIAQLKSRVTGKTEKFWLPKRYGVPFMDSEYIANLFILTYNGENGSACELAFRMRPKDDDNENGGEENEGFLHHVFHMSRVYRSSNVYATGQTAAERLKEHEIFCNKFKPCRYEFPEKPCL